MLLGSLVVIMAVMLVPRLGIELGSAGRLAPYAIFLICPLLHIGMMVFMFKGKKEPDSEARSRDTHQVEI